MQNGDLMGEFLTYLRLEGKSPHTLRSYRDRLAHLDRFLDGAPVLEVDRNDLIEWRTTLTTLADTSVTTYVAAVRSFFRWAVMVGYLSRSPATAIPTPRLGRRLPRPIGEDDLQWAISQAIGRIRAFLVLAGYAGLRCIEISRLRRECLFPHAELPYMIVHGKRDKERTVNLSPYVWGELQLYRLPRRGWVFPRLDGRMGHVPPGCVSQSGNLFLHSLGIDETMHQLRHRFGTVGYQRTGNLRELQELMGHADISTTAGYAAHSSPAAAALVNAVQPTAVTLRVVQDETS